MQDILDVNRARTQKQIDHHVQQQLAHDDDTEANVTSSTPSSPSDYYYIIVAPHVCVAAPLLPKRADVDQYTVPNLFGSAPAAP